MSPIMDADITVSATKPNRSWRRRVVTPRPETASIVPKTADRFIREPECREITGLSRSTRWRLERNGRFPQRRQISAGATGWLASELAAWIAERAA